MLDHPWAAGWLAGTPRRHCWLLAAGCWLAHPRRGSWLAAAGWTHMKVATITCQPGAAPIGQTGQLVFPPLFPVVFQGNLKPNPETVFAPFSPCFYQSGKNVKSPKTTLKEPQLTLNLAVSAHAQPAGRPTEASCGGRACAALPAGPARALASRYQLTSGQ